MRGIWLITLISLAAGAGWAGTGTNPLLLSPPSTGAPIRSPLRASPAADPPRPEWSDPRSLLDESRPPTPSSGGTPGTLKSWQQRDLPQLDQMRHEMDLRNEPDVAKRFLDDMDWYMARERQQNGLRLEPLPKPPAPPSGRSSVGDVTPFDLEEEAAQPGQQPPATQPTTRPAE